MTSQEEWREIGYQRSLGEQGITTGSMYNQQGYETYQQNQAREQQFWDDAYNSASSATPAAPTIFRGPGRSSAPVGNYSYGSTPGRAPASTDLFTVPDFFGGTATWFWWLLAGLGAFGGWLYAAGTDIAVGMAVTGGIGAPLALAIVYVAVTVLIALVNLAVAIIWFAIKLAFWVAVGGGILWAIAQGLQMFSA